MSQPSLTPERLQDMKSAIHGFLSQASVYSSIRSIVDSYIADSEGGSLTPDSPSEIMKIIKEKGVINNLLLRIQNEAPQKTSSINPLSIGDSFYLHVRLNGGKSFVDVISAAPHHEASKVFVAFQFGKQRFSSDRHACSSNPQFKDEFLFSLDATEFGFPTCELIEIAIPLHIAVFREDVSNNSAELIGENIVDWRRVLKSGYLGLTVELCGRNAGVPAGILELQLEVVSPKKVRYSESDISSRLEQQREAITAADREFLIYARRWWTEFQGASQQHTERRVKLFATTTNGRMVPVTHFVSPMQASYGLSAPCDALRFVSLLKTVDTNENTPFGMLEGGKARTWLPCFVFLSQRQGHPWNHAALLCSLLLGFGLDAFCAVGAATNGETVMYVITRSRTSNGEFQVTIWDPVIGERFSVTGSHNLQSVDCVFNHRSFFSNFQPSSLILSTSFDIENEQLWKPINPLKLRLVPKCPAPPLIHKSIALERLEKGLEIKLRNRLCEQRDLIGQQTHFDDNLSYALLQALENYERQRSTGREEDFSMFEQCVKGLLGPGKTFKAIPVNVSFEDDLSIMSIIEASDAGKEVLETVAENVKFGLRVRLFQFPEEVRSVWVMFAVAYRNNS